jgi:predicted membrane protein (TIGR00267 family)
MGCCKDLRLLLRISRSHDIARRYFVTNGFDGALAMLGLNMGFYVTGGTSVRTALGACLGTAIALMMSGLSSAYVSESAERQRELRDLEQAMVTDLGESAHARAARLIPVLIAAVNGLAPFSIALLTISPLWVSTLGIPVQVGPVEASICLAFLAMFLLGVFLGRVSGTFWLWSALRTLGIGAATVLLIVLTKV